MPRTHHVKADMVTWTSKTSTGYWRDQRVLGTWSISQLIWKSQGAPGAARGPISGWSVGEWQGRMPPDVLLWPPYVYACILTSTHYTLWRKEGGRVGRKKWRTKKEMEKGRREQDGQEGQQHLLTCPLCICATNQRCQSVPTLGKASSPVVLFGNVGNAFTDQSRVTSLCWLEIPPSLQARLIITEGIFKESTNFLNFYFVIYSLFFHLSLLERNVVDPVLRLRSSHSWDNDRSSKMFVCLVTK